MTEATQVVQNWTKEDRIEAARIKDELNIVLNSVQAQEQGLEKDFVKLGSMLEEVRERKFWLIYEYKSFNTFLESIAPRVGKGRTRLYATLNVAKQLLPYIAPQELTDLGISKASALASAVKKSGGKKPADELLAALKDKKTTLEQAHELIADGYGAREEFEMGTWLSLAGVYFSPEEKEEFYRAVKAACLADPPLAYTIDKWEDATAPQRKEILWRWTASFLAEQKG